MAKRKVSISEVVPSRRMGGEDLALLTPKSVGATSGFLGTMSLRPGEYVGSHYHPYSEEFLFVVTGRLTVLIDGEEFSAGLGDAVFIPTGAEHRIENRGETTAYAVYQNGPLAPDPKLGHVDCEDMPAPAELPPSVGG
jgi:putative monooxygenase